MRDGFYSKRSNSYVSGVRASQHVGESINGYTKKYSKSNKSYYMTRSKCERCGGRLVFREGKYGPFWGCENYPKCKYTEDHYDIYD